MKKVYLQFLILFSVFVSLACERVKNEKPYLTMTDCNTFCETLTQCAETTIGMIQQRKGISPEMQMATKKLSSRRACMQTCFSQIHPAFMFRYPKAFHFYQHFYTDQMQCLKYASDCKAFSACRQMQLHKSIADFPMDPTDQRRCNEACERIHTCADQLVPRIFAVEYAELSLDKQAELVRQFGDQDRCLLSCRFTMIQSQLDRRKITSATDENFQNLEPFFQCLSQSDCGRFVWCVMSQTPPDDLK